MPKLKALVKYLLLLAAVASIVGCDRVSKRVATDILAGEPTQSHFFDTVRLSYAENPGSFLSLGAELPESVRFVLFTLGTPILLVVLVVVAFRTRWSGARLAGLAMFIAGGASNWADRLSDGRVVDFLNLGIGPIRTGIFNVADVAISAGIVILLCSEYLQSRKHRHGGPPPLR
jgi:signal peptidase II